MMRARAELRDERGVMGLGIFRLVIMLVLVAVVGWEAGAVAFARVQADEIATTAAGEAAAAWRDQRLKEAAIAAAQQAIDERDPNARLVRSSLEIAANGRVTLTVVKEARTFIIQHVDFLEGFHIARGTATGVPPLV